MMTKPIYKCPISGESDKEERLNHITHLAGLFLSMIGWGALLTYASLYGPLWYIVSCSVYGATLVALYAASTYYHGCKTIHQKRTLKIVDHACIFLLIAGTYTPFTLGPLRNANGWTLLYIEWSIAVIGVLFKIFSFKTYQLLSTLAYLAMGWLVVFSLPTLIEELPQASTIWLISGGITYSLGALFYLWRSIPFNHAIWHLFVLGGSICHYFAIFQMLKP